MPEGINPVRMVKMCVNAEDLAEASANVMQEGLWEAGTLSKPVAPCQAGKGSVDGRWSGGDGSLRGWCTDSSRSVDCRC